MKKMMALFLAAVLCLSLFACQKQEKTDDAENKNNVTQTGDETGNRQENPTDGKQDDETEKKDPEPNPDENPDTPTEKDEIIWPDTGMAKRIPTPEKGKIYTLSNERTFFRADLTEADAEYAKEYAEKCKEIGFDLDISEDSIDSTTYIFSAKNEKDFKLSVTYTGVLIITLSAPQ